MRPLCRFKHLTPKKNKKKQPNQETYSTQYVQKVKFFSIKKTESQFYRLFNVHHVIVQKPLPKQTKRYTEKYRRCWIMHSLAILKDVSMDKFL